MRRRHSCGDIDTALGFVAGIDMPTCDRCWLVGGPSTEAGRLVRENIANETVARIKSRGIERYSPVVQLSIMGRFMSREEVIEAKAKIESTKSEEPTVTWLGMEWIGEPMPKRVVRASKIAVRAFKTALKGKGCGCIKRLKQAVTSST